MEYWIYPGERRPVIVAAKNLEDAEKKVLASPVYDGFPLHVYSVREYATLCLTGMASSRFLATGEIPWA